MSVAVCPALVGRIEAPAAVSAASGAVLVLAFIGFSLLTKA